MSTARIENHIPGGIANASILGHCAISEDDSYALISVLPEDLQLDLSCANTGELINTYCIFVDAAVSQDIRCFVRVDVQTICLFETELVGQQRQFNLRYSDLKFFSDYPERIIVRVEIFHQQDYILTLELNHTITIGDSAKTTVNFCKTSPPIASFGNPKVTSFIKGNLLPYFNEITNNTPINITLAVVYNHLLNVNENFFHYGRINFNDFLDDYSNQDFVVNKSSGFGLCNLKAHFVAQFFDCNASVLGLDNDNTLLDFSHVSNEPEETSLIREFLVKSPEEKIKIFNLIRFPKSAIKIYSLLLEKIFLRYNNFWNVQFDAEVLIKEDRYLKTILSDVELGVPLFCRNSYTSNARKFFNMSWTPYIQDIAKCVHRRIDVPFIYEILAIKVIDIRSGRPLENKRVKRIRIIRQAELYSDLVILSYTPTFNDAAPNNCPLRYRLNLGNNNRYKTTRDALRSFGYPVQETTTDTADNEDNEDIEDNEDNEFDDTDRASITHYLRDRGVTETEVADISAETTNTKLDNIITYIIRDFENCLETDELGTLNIMIPKGYMDGHRVAIQLGFYEFPIIEEHDGFIRPGTNIAPTNFEIRWDLPDSEQQIDGWEQLIDWAQIDTPENNPTSRHFGWEVRNGNHSTFLKTCLYKVIKNDYDDFESFISAPHFDSIEHPFHMILFGMQWCQPILAPIPETATHWIKGFVCPRTGTSRGSFEPIPEDSRNFPVFVTTHIGGGTGQGRDYGALVIRRSRAYSFEGIQIPSDQVHLYETLVESYTSNNRTTPRQVNGENRPHFAIDYFSIDESQNSNTCINSSPLFVFHGGIFRRTNHSGSGFQCRIEIRNITKHGERAYSALYTHLNQSPPGNDGEIVLSGKRIGFAGRTTDPNPDPNLDPENIPTYNEAPTHLHLEILVHLDYPDNLQEAWRLVNHQDIFNFSNEPENNHNRRLLLGADGYRLFPCDCFKGTFGAYRCSLKAGANDNNIYRLCWAYRNLHCPYIRPEYHIDNRIARIKAQLRFLHLHRNHFSYLNPGNAPEEDWSTEKQAAIRKFRLINNILFRNEDGSLNDVAMRSEPGVDDATMEQLNLICENLNNDVTELNLTQKLHILFSRASEYPFSNPMSNESPNNWGQRAQIAIRRFRELRGVDNHPENGTEPEDGSATMDALNNLIPYPRNPSIDQLEEK